ncbi:unnamed protein product [Closterium sp. Yama58-4]|nr:unnamed protein product [Closterium sp. Yama58-4]
MLVVITACKAVHMTDDVQINLKQWVAPLVESRAVTAFKDSHLNAPDDLVLRLARLALSCTAMPTASRPTMGRVLGDLLGMQEEVLGGAEVHGAACKIDREIGSSAAHSVDFDAQLARVEQIGSQSHSRSSAEAEAHRPTMGRVLGDLLGIKEEVLERAEAHRAACCIDREIGSSAGVDFNAQLARVEQMGTQSHSSRNA